MKNTLIDIINQIEKDFNVQKWSIMDIDIWPIVRKIIFFNSLGGSNSGENKNQYDKERLTNLSQFLNKKKEIDVLFLFDSIRLLKVNDSLENRLSGPFIDELKMNGLKIGNLQYSIYNSENYLSNNDSCLILNQMKEASEKIPVRFCELEDFNLVKNYFEKHTQTSFIFPSLIELNDIGYEIYYLSTIFEKILKTLNTKFVFTEIYHHIPSYAMSVAAKRSNIKCIEIQHGLFVDMLWFKWNSISKNGYNTLPDIFWCWDQSTANKINLWADKTNTHYAIHGGNPWVENWKIKNSNFTSKNLIIKDEINILITLQTVFGISDWENCLPLWVYEAIKKSPSNWKWKVRYHPLMFGKFSHERDYCEEILEGLINCGKVETKQSSEKLILEVLSECDIHVTPFSTSTIEAMHMNVPTVIIHNKGETLREFVEELYTIKKALTEEELLVVIQEILNDKLKGNISKIETTNLFRRKLNSILQKDNFNYASRNIVNNLFLEDVYLSDKSYFEFSNEYSDTLSVKYLFGKAKYQELLGNKDEVNYYYNRIVERILEEDNSLNIVELIDIKNFFEAECINQQADKIKYYIKQKIFHDKNLIDSFFFRLFKKKNYQEIKKWKKEAILSMDTSFFIGRALLYLGENDEGITYLEKYLYIREETTSGGRTYKQKFYISAIYYIGDTYYKNGEFQKALKYFLLCDKHTNGRHTGAKKYINVLNKM